MIMMCQEDHFGWCERRECKGQGWVEADDFNNINMLKKNVTEISNYCFDNCFAHLACESAGTVDIQSLHIYGWL